jgi:peptide/nickel transport system substrate-binding protein
MHAMNLTRRAMLKGTAFVGMALAVRSQRPLFAAEGSTLRSRMNADINKIDPGDWASHGERDTIDTIYAKLINFKPGDKWEWELEAAESIEQVDQTHIKFTLRPKIMFTQDAGETTAEDVKFSYERIANPDNKFAYRDDWAVLDHVEVTDTYSGVIVLKEPFAPLWGSTLPWSSGSIVCKKAVEAMEGKRFTTDPGPTSGPYSIAEWQPKQKLTLKRNPGWPIFKPDFDEIVLMPIDDDNASEVAYLAGELDYTRVSQSSVLSFRDKLPADSQMLERPTLDYVWLGMNIEHPNFRDPKVREAIQKAVDVQSILDGVYVGTAKYATGVVGPGLPGHLDTPVPQRDVEGAKKLMAESEQPNGFKTTLYTLPRTDRISTCQIIQQNLAEIGIEVEIMQTEAGQFWSLMDTVGKNIEMYLTGFGGAPDPSWGTMWFTPDQVGVWNWERWNSPEFGEMNTQLLGERDEAKRDAGYKKMQDMMEESGAYLFLTHEANAFISRDTVEPGLKPDGTVILTKFAAKA